MNRLPPSAVEPPPSDLTPLLQVSLEINRSLKLEEILQASLSGIERVVGGKFGCFLLRQAHTDRLELTYAHDLPTALSDPLSNLSFPVFATGVLGVTEQRNLILGTIGEQIRVILNAHQINTFLLVPLTAREQGVGILLVNVTNNKILTPRSIDMLTAIGEQIGMAIENARLHATLAESEAWHRTFIENSLDGFLEGLYAKGKNITYVNDATCQMLGMTRAEILNTSSADLFVNDLNLMLEANTELFRAGFLSNQLTKVRTMSGAIKTVSYTSYLVRGNGVNPSRFQVVMHDVTEQEANIALLKHREQEQTALNAIAQILSHPLEFNTSLENVCNQITCITGMETVALHLINPAEQCLEICAYQGVDSALLGQIQRLGLDDPITRRIVVESKPIALDDLALSNLPGLAGPRAEQYHAGLGVPILRGDVTIGAIFAGSRTRRSYGKSDVTLLLNIGKQIGVALENAELYKQMQQRVNELDGLAQLSAACASSLDPRAIAELAVSWTRQLLPSDLCSVRLVETKTQRLIAGYISNGAPLRDQMDMDDMLRAIVDRRTAVVVSNVETDPWLSAIHRQGFSGIGIRSVMIVPLPARSHVIGTLAIGRQAVHAWTPSENELLQTIANQVGMALENAQLFQNVLNEQRKVQAIFDSGLSGLYATDAQGQIVLFNRAAERITGWTLAEVQGQSWRDLFVPPDDQPPVDPLINQALLYKKTVLNYEGRHIHARDGRPVPVAQAVAPLLNEKDAVIGAVGAFWDLSREQAAEISREKFLTEVAHQLRSPLTAVLCALDLYERPSLSKKRRAEMWGLIVSEGERLKKFADQFLDHQATVTLPRAMRWETFALVPLVRALTDTAQLVTPRREIQVRAPKTKSLVYADRDRVENVLRNLLDNAISYSLPNSPITVTLRVAGKDQIEIAVHNEGTEIPIADQAKIFQRFYRSTQTGGRSLYGHGLGLAIARELVQSMGGTIWLKSTAQHGTTFYFTLRRSHETHDFDR